MRHVLIAAALLALPTPAPAACRGFGLIGKIAAKPGQRAALVAALSAGSAAMPGNLAYDVAEDAADLDLIWVHERWRDEASWKASLTLPQVRAAIARGRPLIAKFESVARTCPVERRSKPAQ